MKTFTIYSAKQQGSLSKGEIIAVQSLEVFEKYNGKWGVENYSTITNLSNQRVYVEKCIQNIFILPDVNGKFRVTEAFERKGSFSHSDGDILGGFKSKKDAQMYCKKFDLNIVNNN